MITKTRKYRPSLIPHSLYTDDEVEFLNKLGDKENSKFGFKFKERLEDEPLKDYRNTPRYRFNKDGTVDLLDYNFTYNFSSAIRNNLFINLHPRAKEPMVKYGQSGWSFRLLYEFLCDAFNGGIPFIDTYFEQVFHTRPVYAKWLTIFDEINEKINDEMQYLPLNKDGTPSKKSLLFKGFKVWKDDYIAYKCQQLADKIRKDIEVCLSTSLIPLNGKQGNKVSKNTRLIRSNIGGMKNLYSLFYASGQLIQNLNIFVEVSDKEAQAA